MSAKTPKNLMQDKQAIAFTVTVTEEDWDSRLGGWRCPALRIPGAAVESVYVSSRRVDSSQYEIKSDLSIVRWALPEQHPQQATLHIKLTETLSTEELTLKWKKFAIVLPAAATVFTALLAGFISHIINRGSLTDISTVTTCSDKIKIIAPSDNQFVRIQTKVTGTSQNLSPGEKLYILVYPSDVARFYPQLNPVINQSGDTWSCDVLIGLDRDVGRRFAVYAVLANKEAQKYLETVS